MGQELQFIGASEMRELLRAVYAGDSEGKLLTGMVRRLRDPAMPFDASGRSRPHPLGLALLLIFMVAAASFFVFTLLGR